jgi:hypothetical protein
MAMFNTRLNTNGCALSSGKVFSSALLFLNMEDSEFRISPRFSWKNKGTTVDTQARVGKINTVY